MPRLLLEKPVPRASTCILLGEPPADLDVSSYRHLFWCAPQNAQWPAAATPVSLERYPIDAAAAPSFAEALDRFIRRDPRRLPSLLVSDTILAQHSDRFERALAETHQTLESHNRARITRQKDGFLWQKHVLQNLNAYTRGRIPSHWANALTGLPAFVVGAGPSLDASIGRLAAHASGAVVFAADSALRALAKRGVLADFTVSIDVAKVPEKCLPADLSPARVVLSPVSPPAWNAAIPAVKRFYVSNSQVTIDWIAAQGIERTPVGARENCGSTALDLARFLGCSPIYLFGLDLAADANEGARHHAGADASLYSNSGYKATSEGPRVPGNYCDSLPSFVYGDWHVLDERLSGWPEDLVFNVNDRGARLSNTTLVHPDRFSLASPPAAKEAALARLCASFAPPAEAVDRVAQGLRTLHTRGMDALPRMRAGLARSGPAAAVNELRKFFSDPAVGPALGAFSLKIMPHLVPPVEGDAAFWTTLLDELEELLALPM